jgi:heme-degrading monooxygenase HmoA
MIVRVYRAKIRPGKERIFEEVALRSHLNVVKRQPGCLDVVMGRTLGAQYEFVVVTKWKDLASLQNFAGRNWNKPVPLPDEQGLVEDSTVENYEVLATQDGPTEATRPQG